MSLEAYSIHIAPRGGKIDLIVDQINAERKAATEARYAYSRSKGADGIYADERSVSGLLFKSSFADKELPVLPDGWARILTTFEGVVAAPKAKDRTKVAREACKAQKAELAALPRLPGAWEFTNRIGGSQTIGQSGTGFCLMNCWFERVGETTFIMTPWSTKQDETGNLDDDSKVKTSFQPEGCERVPLSAYYLAKENLK